MVATVDGFLFGSKQTYIKLLPSAGHQEHGVLGTSLLMCIHGSCSTN